MADTPNPALSPFAQHLVATGLLAETQALDLSEQARGDDTPLLEYLEVKKWIDPTTLAEAAAYFFSLPLYDLDVHITQEIPHELLSLNIVRDGRALPLLKRGNSVVFAVADPELIKPSEITFTTGLQVNLILVEGHKLRTLIADMIESQTLVGLDSMAETTLESLNITPYEEFDSTFSTDEANDTPVVTYINKLLLKAIESQASDIHFEPDEKDFRVRYRIDGILLEASRSPIQVAGPMVARLKILANLDIAEHRVPQDGRFKINLSATKTIDFRISTCPTLFGETVVLRILDPEAMPLDIKLLGMEDFQQKIYLEAIRASQGIILVTGPTGSGKTISLYTAIKILNSIQKNICTVEDPIEIYMPGVNQVHMNLKTGMTFAKSMRAFLRQDPDIIMVGEIRDFETADIAIKAAETGHLVLSTLHTVNAPMALARLSNMGVDQFNIASSVTLVVAQRLLRNLCKHCKQHVKLPPEVLIKQGFTESEIDDLVIYGPGNCSKCSHGYKGRTGIFELMPISDAMVDIIIKGGDSTELAHQAEKEGILNLRAAGLEKVKAGITSLGELNRIISIR